VKTLKGPGKSIPREYNIPSVDTLNNRQHLGMACVLKSGAECFGCLGHA